MSLLTQGKECVKIVRNLTSEVKNLEKRAGKTLICLRNEMARAMEVLIGEEDLSRAQGSVLHFIFLLGKKQNVYQKDIEQEFNIRRATASELLQKLENASYIIRLNDPDDKRLKRIEITKKGEMHVNKIQERIQKMETILCDQIQKEDLDVFFQVITQMYKNCKSVQQDKKGEIS